MDPVGSIVSITAQVLRRLADAVEASEPAAPPVTIHIETLIVNDVEQVPALRERWSRSGLLGRKS